MVIIGVLAGPSLSTCFNSEGGMGMCLRGKMVDAGILPQPAVAVAEPVTAPAAETPAAVQPEVASATPALVAEPEVAAVEPEVAVAEPALDVTPPAETPAVTAPDTLIAATFGLLRAEPDGSMVIAGSGTPGTEVEVYSDDQLLGKTKVEASGDWVLVPDAPIPPGGTELTLAEAGKQGRAAQSFVVVVNDDKKSEPLVVASTPGHASDILQGLERPAAGTTTEVAAADPQTPAPATEVAPTAEPAVPTTAPAAEAAPEPAPATEPAVTPEATAPAATAPTTTPEVAATAPAAEPPAVVEPPVAETAVPAAAEPAATEAKPDVAVATAEPAVPPTTEPAAVLANIPPTIDAIEIEGDKSFFAGGGPEGAVMRLYVDGSYIADATVADGRWLVEAGKVLTKPNQRIRIDMLKPGTADVAARAEVDFQVETPGEKPTAVAAAEPPKPIVAATPDQPVPATEVAEIAAPAATAGADDKAAPLDVAAATVTPPATPEDKSGAAENRTAPTETVAAVKPAEQPAAAIDNAAKPETAAVADAVTPTPDANKPAAPVEAAKAETPEAAVPVETAPTVTAEATAPAEPAAEVAEPAAVDAAAAAEVQTAEAAPAEPVAESDVPTMVAVPVGDPEMARFASGKAIIRHGDNLWTIARRVYGAGIKYTTIYEANNGQIRNPNKIYPGQVFDLPGNAN